MTRVIEVRVPDMGNFKDVAVIDVLVKPGDTIEIDGALVTLETEKATMDVPSTVAGIIDQVIVRKGGTLSPGDVVAKVRVEEADGAAAAAGTSGPGAAAGASSAPVAPPAAEAAAGAGAGAHSGAGPGAGSGASAGSGSGAGAGSGASVGSGAGAGAGSGASVGSGSGASSALGMDSAPSEAAKAAVAQASLSASPGGAPARASGGRSAATSVALPAGASANSGTPAAASASPAAAASHSGELAPGAALAPIDETGFSSAHASPSVRRFARELGVDLGRITGTGFKSRITEEDVKGFVKKALSGSAGAATGAGAAAGVAGAGAGVGAAAGAGAKGGAGGRGLPSVPVVDFAAFGPTETKALSRIQKISGARLHASWVNLPHVTQFDEADITDLEEIRNGLKKKAAEQSIKLTPLAFIIRACVKALQEFPTFNSSLDAGGENLILKQYIHIGFAADTPNGLMVPVVRDADRKDIYELARSLAELSEKARAGTLNVAQMQGGSFTISSLGGIGGTAFTPIINAPEVAILGVSRSALRPVYKHGAFVPRLILPLSLSYDHRVIDGALAARFTTYLAQVLADARALVEAVP